MNVVAVSIGGRTRLSFDGEHLETGIVKSPVQGAAYLTQTGFRGDVQVNRQNHGGPDKAVCVYCSDHYHVWNDESDESFGPGLFGENLTITGMHETDVRIGDVFAVGEVEVQVSQPRQPCHKLSKKVGDLSFSDRVIKTGMTGFYFRVLKEGLVQAGDPVTVVSSNEDACSVAYANGVMYDKLDGDEGLEKLLSDPLLADAWKKPLESRRR